MSTTTFDRSRPSPTPTRPGGDAAVAGLGTLGWVDRTGGQLSGAERRSLLGPVARTHVASAAGRLSMLVRLNSGRRARVAPSLLVAPTSALTRAAVEQAQRRLSPALLNHSYRTFAFGAALGALEGLTVDAELLAPRRCCTTPASHQRSERRLHPRQRPHRARRSRRGRPVLGRYRDDAHRDHAAHQPERPAGAWPRGLPAGRRRGRRRRRPAVLAAAPGPARHGGGTASPARFQGRVHRRVPHRGHPCAPRRVQFLRRYGAFDLAIRLAPFRG